MYQKCIMISQFIQPVLLSTLNAIQLYHYILSLKQKPVAKVLVSDFAEYIQGMCKRNLLQNQPELFISGYQLQLPQLPLLPMSLFGEPVMLTADCQTSTIYPK